MDDNARNIQTTGQSDSYTILWNDMHQLSHLQLQINFSYGSKNDSEQDIKNKWVAFVSYLIFPLFYLGMSNWHLATAHTRASM